MSIDRAVRSLSGLNGASSSRVLNLAAIAIARADDPGHKKNPFFESPVLNGSIVLKHRLRADETDLFATSRSIGTKVIVPFEKTDLRAGGGARCSWVSAGTKICSTRSETTATRRA